MAPEIHVCQEYNVHVRYNSALQSNPSYSGNPARMKYSVQCSSSKNNMPKISEKRLIFFFSRPTFYTDLGYTFVTMLHKLIILLVHSVSFFLYIATVP